MTTTKRNPRRMIVTVVISLLAGALTTVAVAWVFALVYDELPGSPTEATAGWLPLDEPDGTRFASVSVAQKHAPGALWVTVHTWGWSGRSGAVPAADRARQYQPAASLPMEECRASVVESLRGQFGNVQSRPIIEARGWPMHALWCMPIEQSASGPPAPTPLTATCGIALPLAEPYGAPLRLRTLPLRPLWTGFLINTAVYACAWLVLVLGFTRTRRFIRRRRGRCPLCAYRLADADIGCSECGWGRGERSQQVNKSTS